MASEQAGSKSNRKFVVEILTIRRFTSPKKIY